MIKLDRICGGYGRETKLFDVSLSVPGKTILSIVGPNGCGKSTLLRSIAGLQPLFSGDILLKGIPLNRIHHKDLAKQVSYLPQSRNIPAITVYSMVLHGRFPYLSFPRCYRPEDRNIASQAMEWAGVLPFQDKEMAMLSGGERQKVYLAMVLAQSTPLILLDEPTTYLDIRHQLEIMHLVQKMKKAGKSVVMVLHDLNLALTYSDLVAVIHNGRLESFGTPDEIYQSGILSHVFEVSVLSQRIGVKPQYFFEMSEEK